MRGSDEILHVVKHSMFCTVLPLSALYAYSMMTSVSHHPHNDDERAGMPSILLVCGDISELKPTTALLETHTHTLLWSCQVKTGWHIYSLSCGLLWLSSLWTCLNTKIQFTVDVEMKNWPGEISWCSRVANKEPLIVKSAAAVACEVGRLSSQTPV